MVGYWHKIKGRCQRCNRFVNNIYVVKDPIQGQFCSGFCARDAYRQMNEGLTDQELKTIKEAHGQ